MASYTSLETNTSIPGISFDTNTKPSLSSSFSLIFTLAIIACIAATAFVYIKGGLFRLQASEAGVRKSNEEFKRGTLGLLGVLSMWLLLYTLNKGILLGDVGLDGLRARPVTGQVAVINTQSTSTPQVVTDGSEAQNRATLAAVGITINKDPCVGNSTNCTNVGGINPKTISMLIALKGACGCDIQITGGTEPGHSTNSNHGVGKEAIDISLTDKLNTFLKQSGNTIQNSPPCNIRYAWGSFIFWDEATGCDSVGGPRHFHASFTGY